MSRAVIKSLLHVNTFSLTLFSLFPPRAVTQAWDLQSLLIKPVQRVLKYPLLLGKLAQTTGDGHPDYMLVHRAREVIGQVAQDINEIKRRKDLGESVCVMEDRSLVWGEGWLPVQDISLLTCSWNLSRVTSHTRKYTHTVFPNHLTNVA